MWFKKNLDKKAVLIVHGFAGGTYDQEILANNLELEGFAVYTFTLPGHEKSFLKKVTRNEWIDECKYQIERLINHGYKEIFVIGSPSIIVVFDKGYSLTYALLLPVAAS